MGDAALGTRSLLVTCSTWRSIPLLGISDISMRHMGRSAGSWLMAHRHHPHHLHRHHPRHLQAVVAAKMEKVCAAAAAMEQDGSGWCNWSSENCNVCTGTWDSNAATPP